MIADGLFERFPCEAIFGLHNHPGVPAGTFGFRAGPMMAAADRVKVRIHGRGGHAARPHLTIDPVVVGSSIVMALQTIVSRNVDPNEAAVVTVGSFRAGHAPNVIPEDAVLEMSVRSFSPEVRDIVAKRMRDAAISVRARKGAERAAYVLSVARAVREAGLITSPPREVGFLLAFFQKALGALAHQSGGQLRVPMSAAPSAPQAPEGEAAPE